MRECETYGDEDVEYCVDELTPFVEVDKRRRGVVGVGLVVRASELVLALKCGKDSDTIRIIFSLRSSF